MPKLLIWKGYHGLLHIYMPYKQNGTTNVLPLMWYQYLVWPMNYMAVVSNPSTISRIQMLIRVTTRI